MCECVCVFNGASALEDEYFCVLFARFRIIEHMFFNFAFSRECESGMGQKDELFYALCMSFRLIEQFF